MVREMKSKPGKENPSVVFNRTRIQPSPARPLENTFGILPMALGNILDTKYSVNEKD